MVDTSTPGTVEPKIATDTAPILTKYYVTRKKYAGDSDTHLEESTAEKLVSISREWTSGCAPFRRISLAAIDDGMD